MTPPHPRHPKLKRPPAPDSRVKIAHTVTPHPLPFPAVPTPASQGKAQNLGGCSGKFRVAAATWRIQPSTQAWGQATRESQTHGHGEPQGDSTPTVHGRCPSAGTAVPGVAPNSPGMSASLQSDAPFSEGSFHDPGGNSPTGI